MTFTAQRIKAAIKAGMKPVIWKPGTRRAVKSSRAALITNVNRPRVRMLIGSVKINMIGFMSGLRIPRTSATIKAVVKVSTRNPGTYWDTTSMARADKSQLMRIRNTKISICEHIFNCKRLKRKCKVVSREWIPGLEVYGDLAVIKFGAIVGGVVDGDAPASAGWSIEVDGNGEGACVPPEAGGCPGRAKNYHVLVFDLDLDFAVCYVCAAADSNR